MTSLPCPLPASKVVFPDLAPAPSVVAADPLGLYPGTAASPDLSYSQPPGPLLSYSYPIPTQQPQGTPTCPASNSQPRLLGPSTGRLNTRRAPKQVSVASAAFLSSGVWLVFSRVSPPSDRTQRAGIQTLLGFHGIWGRGRARGGERRSGAELI